MIPRRLFWISDFLMMTLAFVTAYELAPLVQSWLSAGGFLAYSWVDKLSPPSSLDGQFPPLGDFFWILIATVPLTILFIELVGLYGRLVDQSFARILVCTFLAPFFGLSFLTLGLFATKQTAWSRLVVFLFAALSGLILSLFRILVRAYHLHRRSAGYYNRNVLIVGSASGIEWLTGYFKSALIGSEYRLYGYLNQMNQEADHPADHAGISRLGHVGQIGDILVHQPIHEVIVAYTGEASGWLKQVLKECDYFRIGLRIIPEGLLSEQPRELQILALGDSLNLPAVVMVPPQQHDSDALFLKRVFDIVVSAALLFLFAPVFLIIAIAIKLTTPALPVFYHWRVVGQNGVEFTGYKFTTMVPDAEKRRHELLSKNEMSGPVFKIKDDPRVTRLGRFLRKYSLNELPQLWSVLTGHMSLVGPRPAFRHELERYKLWHKRKLSVKPGITCLWQVRGRNNISNFDDWVRMDLEYMENWSLLLDLKILLRTAWVVIRGTGS